MKALAIGLLGLLGPLAEPPSRPSPGSERTLYYFFSPDTPGQAEIARRAVDYVLERGGALRLRTVLLVSDFGALGRVQEESGFTKGLKELGRISEGPLDLAIYDEEGLALARAWKICRLPALVQVAGGRAHVATGSRARPQDLEDCR
jgi:hypothetical protein